MHKHQPCWEGGGGGTISEPSGTAQPRSHLIQDQARMKSRSGSPSQDNAGYLDNKFDGRVYRRGRGEVHGRGVRDDTNPMSLAVLLHGRKHVHGELTLQTLC